MLADYLKAAIPEPVTLLGQRLLPFSIGHYMLLTRLGNRFLTVGDPDLFDLLQGVFVCSQTYSGALEAFSIGVPVKGWFRTRRLGFNEVLSHWRKSLGAFDVLGKSEDFARYLRDGMHHYQPHQGSEEGRRPGGAFIHRVAIVLVTELRRDWAEVWDIPYGQAVADYYAYWEFKDKLKLFNADELANIEEAERILKEENESRS